jgi:hypothetical protein
MMELRSGWLRIFCFLVAIRYLTSGRVVL